MTIQAGDKVWLVVEEEEIEGKLQIDRYIGIFSTEEKALACIASKHQTLWDDSEDYRIDECTVDE